MTRKAILSQIQHLTVIFQESYMSSANLMFALFLTIYVGLGALAASLFPEFGQPARHASAPVGGSPRGRRALRRLARAQASE